jgi:tetratricopeptide (TPR) repeat protein
LACLGKRPEAEVQYRQALAIREKLAADFPDVPQYQIDLGGICCNLGHLVRDSGRPSDSLPWFEKAIRTLSVVYEKERQLVEAKEFLRNSHAGRASAHDRLHKLSEAVKDWDKAIELTPKAEQATYRIARAATRVKADHVAETVAEVAELMKQPGAPGPILYDFACFYAIASAKSTDNKQPYADRAIDLLQQAIKAGYHDAAHMKKDTDLDPLRERDDFKKLLADLEKKGPPNKQP